MLGIAPLDFVHVHEPFAPSTSSVALRHSRALNVGSFHAPTERVLSTQVARRFVELFFGRLDARTAAFDATRELMERSFPAEYRLLRPGAAAVDREQRAAGEGSGPLRIAFCAQEERAALRLFLRALRRLPDDVDWRATVFSPTGAAPTGALRSRVRDRVRVVTAEDDDRGRGARRRRRRRRRVARPGARARADRARARRRRRAGVRAAARLRGGARRRRPRPALRARRRRRARRPARAARRASRELLRRLGEGVRAAREGLSWARVADEAEAIYAELAARRRPPRGRRRSCARGCAAAS